MAAGCDEAELEASTEGGRAWVQSWEQLGPQNFICTHWPVGGVSKHPKKDPVGAERREGPDEVRVFASVVGEKREGKNEVVDDFILAK